MVTQSNQGTGCDSGTVGKKWNKVLKAVLAAAEHIMCFICLSWHCSSEITAGGHQLIHVCFISFVMCAGPAVERVERVKWMWWKWKETEGTGCDFSFTNDCKCLPIVNKSGIQSVYLCVFVNLYLLPFQNNSGIHTHIVKTRALTY